MINKRFSILATVVGIVAAFLISGCTHKPAQIASPKNLSITVQLDHPYPQMYTQYMIENVDAIEKEFDVTFIGCYDDTEGSFILWVNDNKTGKCYASVFLPSGTTDVSCDEGWDLYLRVCAQAGNCEQLI